MSGCTRLRVLCCLVSMSLSTTFAEEVSQSRVDSFGNSWLGGRLETSAGGRNGDAPNVWAQMYGIVQFVGNDYEAVGMAMHSLGGGVTDNFFGLRLVGQQVVSSSDPAAIAWSDARSLPIRTPRIPVYTLLGVIDFELAVGGLAGYRGGLYVTSDASRAWIFGGIRGWVQGFIEFGISVLGIGGGGVRATVRPFDMELNAAFSAFSDLVGGRVWLHSYGVRIWLELYGWVLFVSDSVTLVDATFGEFTWDLINF